MYCSSLGVNVGGLNQSQSRDGAEHIDRLPYIRWIPLLEESSALKVLKIKLALRNLSTDEDTKAKLGIPEDSIQNNYVSPSRSL